MGVEWPQLLPCITLIANAALEPRYSRKVSHVTRQSMTSPHRLLMIWRCTLRLLDAWNGKPDELLDWRDRLTIEQRTAHVFRYFSTDDWLARLAGCHLRLSRSRPLQPSCQDGKIRFIPNVQRLSFQERVLSFDNHFQTQMWRLDPDNVLSMRKFWCPWFIHRNVVWHITAHWCDPKLSWSRVSGNVRWETCKPRQQLNHALDSGTPKSREFRVQSTLSRSVSPLANKQM